MELKIAWEGGDKITAAWDDLKVETEQDGSLPSPFELFLASLGTCAGFYVASFCKGRGIDPAGVRITQRVAWNEQSHGVERIAIEIALPEGFPERYRDAVLRAAGTCAVKKALENPPELTVTLA